MPPRPVHGSPEEWLRRSQTSLALARVQGEGVLLEDLCDQAQQAAEKAMKAVYIARGKEFLFTHDLDRLAMGLELIGIEITEPVEQATILTRYAMDIRYPGGFEPVSAAEHQEAIHLAETVIAWAIAQIAASEE
jgi:HEPN domain-containing protein